MKKTLSNYADLFKKYPNAMIAYSVVALTLIGLLFGLPITMKTSQFNGEDNFIKGYAAKCESLHGTVVSSPYRCFTGKRIFIKVRTEDVAQ